MVNGVSIFLVLKKNKNTLERIYDLQQFCKSNTIPLKIFFMSNDYLELENFKINENFRYIVDDLIDWSWFGYIKVMVV